LQVGRTAGAGEASAEEEKTSFDVDLKAAGASKLAVLTVKEINWSWS